jgi:DoxX
VGNSARAEELSSAAARVYQRFNDRFWSSELGYCYDVVDSEGGGNDASLDRIRCSAFRSHTRSLRRISGSRRVALGMFFALSGGNKLFVASRTKVMYETLAAAKVPFPRPMTYCVSAVEFVRGCLLVVGLLSCEKRRAAARSCSLSYFGC